MEKQGGNEGGGDRGEDGIASVGGVAKETKLPVLVIKDRVLFPGGLMRLSVSRPKSIGLVEMLVTRDGNMSVRHPNSIALAIFTLKPAVAEAEEREQGFGPGGVAEARSVESRRMVTGADKKKGGSSSSISSSSTSYGTFLDRIYKTGCAAQLLQVSRSRSSTGGGGGEYTYSVLVQGMGRVRLVDQPWGENPSSKGAEGREGGGSPSPSPSPSSTFLGAPPLTARVMFLEDRGSPHDAGVQALTVALKDAVRDLVDAVNVRLGTTVGTGPSSNSSSGSSSSSSSSSSRSSSGRGGRRAGAANRVLNSGRGSGRMGGGGGGGGRGGGRGGAGGSSAEQQLLQHIRAVSTRELMDALAQASPAALADLLMGHLNAPVEGKQRVLEELELAARVRMVLHIVKEQAEVLTLATKIDKEVASSISSRQREFYLRQQLKAIRNELGEGQGGRTGRGEGEGEGEGEDGGDMAELQQMLDDAGLSAEAAKVAARDMRRLKRMQPSQPEYTVIRNYLEVLADLPWRDDKHQRQHKQNKEKGGSSSSSSSSSSTTSKDNVGEEAERGEAAPPPAQQAQQEGGFIEVAEGEGQGEGGARQRQQQEGEEKEDRGYDMRKVQRRLDADHFGLDKVKKRIVQSIAVRALRGESSEGSILCLVGPPGVGKTSLGKSVAAALHRPFQRLALGGVSDEAEIRGHRRTYIGAMPGSVLAALRKAKSRSPVVLLDEVDKLGEGVRGGGGPASALLEVLDPEQNCTFTDHFLNVPFDLSSVLFVATANTLDTIPPPLLDRMEVIHLPGYTSQEKLAIATRFILPKVMRECGITEEHLLLPSSAILQVAQSYTREAGVRQLERELATICRHVAYMVVAWREDGTGREASSANAANGSAEGEGGEAVYTYASVSIGGGGDADADAMNSSNSGSSGDSVVLPQAQAIPLPLSHAMPFPRVVVTASLLQAVLGPPRFQSEVAARVSIAGVCTGLAYTPQGGELLFIECSSHGGKGKGEGGKLTLTGKLGEVMKESALIALTFIRSNEAEVKHCLGLGPIPEAASPSCGETTTHGGEPPGELLFDYSATDIHLHVPAGAVPKDGPSAGVSIACALLSMMTGRCVPPCLAMTGEVTLRGLVLPVGGVKDKVIAAHRGGIKRVILPLRNERDLEDIPPLVRKEMAFTFVSSLLEVFQAAFQPSPSPSNSSHMDSSSSSSSSSSSNGQLPAERERTPLGPAAASAARMSAARCEGALCVCDSAAPVLRSSL